jgi:hypothetical protein
MPEPDRFYRVVTHLPGNRREVKTGNGRKFTKDQAIGFARLEARRPDGVTRVDVEQIETILTVVPAAAVPRREE